MGGWTRSNQVTLAMHALVVHTMRSVRNIRIVGSMAIANDLGSGSARAVR